MGQKSHFDFIRDVYEMQWNTVVARRKHKTSLFIHFRDYTKNISLALHSQIIVAECSNQREQFLLTSRGSSTDLVLLITRLWYIVWPWCTLWPEDAVTKSLLLLLAGGSVTLYILMISKLRIWPANNASHEESYQVPPKILYYCIALKFPNSFPDTKLHPAEN